MRASQALRLWHDVSLGIVRDHALGPMVVVAAGGGGVPVVQDKRGRLAGAPAVVDKDLASALLATDLEGVLVPEIWIAVAETTGIAGLRRTTRDEPDYDVLMRGRLALLDVRDQVHDVAGRGTDRVAPELLAAGGMPVITFSWAWGPPEEGFWRSFVPERAREAVILLTVVGFGATVGSLFLWALRHLLTVLSEIEENTSAGAHRPVALPTAPQSVAAWPHG